LAHAVVVLGVGAGHDQLAFPEAKSAVRLEVRHAAQHALVVEVRPAPFHGLHHVGASSMHHVANLLQDGLGEFWRAGDVGSHARIDGGHGIRSSFCRA
jgi:hypothetical protein